MALSFRYKEVRRPDGTAVKCPIIPVQLAGKDLFTTTALLDSGADVSAMPLAIAEAIGLDLTGVPGNSFGIGGKVKSVQSTVRVAVEKGHERYVFTLPVMVIYDDYQFPVILGRKGFFSQFLITFDEENERVTLKKR